MPVESAVFTREVVDSLLSYAQMAYPNEGILILRGKRRKGVVRVDSVMVPPAAVHSRAYSSFNWFMLPVDMSYVGVAHSHPSGVVMPSHEDKLNASGAIMVILGYPFNGPDRIGVFDRDGNHLPFTVEPARAPDPPDESY
jgi:proteasome lid subunit RPN8/RPN11